MKSNDAKLNVRLEELIRNHKISPQQATSLMNDSGYAYEVTKKLVEMAFVLFSKGDISLRVTERELALTADELDEINTSATEKHQGEPS
jgi:phosphate:Na+ symporter